MPRIRARIKTRGSVQVRSIWVGYDSPTLKCYCMDLKTKRGETSSIIDKGCITIGMETIPESVHADPKRTGLTVVEILDGRISDKWQVLSEYISKTRFYMWVTTIKPKSFIDRVVILYENKKFL